MWFLLLGVVLIALKFLEIGAVAEWSWVWVLSPLAMAVVWWWVADATGYTSRKAMEREEQSKQDRIDRARDKIGQSKRKR